MRLVGRECRSMSKMPELLTFQCLCGQIIATTINQ
jgi:hypothetical protein